jgi:hypothetical protein
MTIVSVPYLLWRCGRAAALTNLTDAGRNSFVGASERTSKMKLRLMSAAFAISLLPVAANAQVTIDMGALTCEQYLAMSPSRSRDFSAWMSGWYSYETRRTNVDVLAHQKNIASLKSWCQSSPQASVMTALQRTIGP